MPRRLMRPARSISLWLTSSASDGASLVVEMKNWLARMVKAGQKYEKRHFSVRTCNLPRSI